MKKEHVSTRNVERIYGAIGAVEARLSNQEVNGLCVIVGKPGLGKTMALQSYHVMQSTSRRIRTYLLRALDLWTVPSMLEALLDTVELGSRSVPYRKTEMFDSLVKHLSRRPAVILIDEIHRIARRASMIEVLKDIHDLTPCAIVMAGEERAERKLLQCSESFYDRVNRGAIVRLKDYTADDVKKMVQYRCEIPVEDAVCKAVYNAFGKSMREITQVILDIEEFSALNGVKEFGLREWDRMTGRRVLREVKSPSTPEEESQNA